MNKGKLLEDGKMNFKIEKTVPAESSGGGQEELVDIAVVVKFVFVVEFNLSFI